VGRKKGEQNNGARILKKSQRLFEKSQRQILKSQRLFSTAMAF
jgi:hypothetical protein